jgi:hypothetical protein
MNHVYNTGKVRIGAQYFQQPRVEMDGDAVRLQSALLGVSSGIDREDKIVVIGCMIIAAVVLLMAMAGWLPGGAA